MAGGLDRRLALAETLAPGPLHSLRLMVRHLRVHEPSYWSLSATFRDDSGLATSPVGGHEQFERDADVQRAWDWVIETTRKRGLETPGIDEQLWRPADSVLDLDRCLEDAFRTLPGELCAFTVDFWAVDFGHGEGLDLAAEFTGRPGAGRPARALLLSLGEAADQLEGVRQWASRASAALGAAFHWRGTHSM